MCEAQILAEYGGSNAASRAVATIRRADIDVTSVQPRVGTSYRGTPKRRAAKCRLSYNEVHALRILPEQIGNEEREVVELQRPLADFGLYARDPAIFAALVEKPAAAQKGLSTMDDCWIELEMLREEIAGDG